MRLIWVVIPLVLIGIAGVQESFAENTSTVTKNGVILTLETDKSVYNQDELVYFTLTIENSNLLPFDYRGRSGCNITNESNMSFLISELGHTIKLLDENAPLIPKDPELDDIQICTSGIVDVTLGPFEKITKKFVWSQYIEFVERSKDSGMYQAERKITKVSPGVYTLEGKLDDVSDDGFKNPLVTEIELFLKPSEEFLLSDSYQVFDLRNEGLMEYNIPYEMNSGKITDINVICNGAFIEMSLDNSEPTKLIVTIPKSMINTILLDDDSDLFIAINDEKYEFKIINNNPDTITIQADVSEVNADVLIIFDSSTRTGNWVKSNCPFDRLLVLEQPPKVQMRAGVDIEHVTCYGNLVKIFKNSDSSPACIKENTIDKLIERGWAGKKFEINVQESDAVIIPEKNEYIIGERVNLNLKSESTPVGSNIDVELILVHNSDGIEVYPCGFTSPEPGVESILKYNLKTFWLAERDCSDNPLEPGTYEISLKWIPDEKTTIELVE